MDIRDTQEQVEPGQGKIAIDFGNPAGTATELLKHLPGIAEKYEVKLHKGTSYTANPNNDTINVTAVNESGSSPTYKGFKHTLPGSGNKEINRITIHGHVIPGIESLDSGTPISDKRYVFVYFEKEDADGKREKPYLICLSESGGTTNNRWYRRTGTPGNYTWSVVSSDSNYSGKDPEKISGFANELGQIKDGLNTDTGYTKPTTPELPNITGSAIENNVEIKINEKSNYDSDNVTVLKSSGYPKGGYTTYLHYLKNNNKMSQANLKNGNDNLTSGGSPINASNVKYVHVYYGNADDKPLLICVAKDKTGTGTTPNEWTYYKNENPTQSGSINWSLESGLNDKNPDGSAAGKNALLVELDKLNDKANSQTVIHLEKTDTEGTIAGTGSSSGKKIYKTGSNGTTTITVTKTVGTAQGPVPQNYVRYTHQGSYYWYHYI